MLQYINSLHTVNRTVPHQSFLFARESWKWGRIGSSVERQSAFLTRPHRKYRFMGSTFMGLPPSNQTSKQKLGQTISLFQSTPRSTFPGIAAYAALWLNWNEIQYLPFLRPVFCSTSFFSIPLISHLSMRCALRAPSLLPESSRYRVCPYVESWSSPDSSHGSHRRDRQTRPEPSSSTSDETNPTTTQAEL